MEREERALLPFRKAPRSTKIARLALLAGLVGVPAIVTTAVDHFSHSHYGTNAPKTPKTPPVLRFDALGSGSSVIDVYPGPLATPSDERHDGTFENGQHAPVICEAVFRLVTSDPSVGEEFRQSAEWYKIESGGNFYFATGTYADVSGGPIAKCDP